MKFDERKKLFQDELTNICQKYETDIYCANVVIPNGEVIPMLKMQDRAKEEELMVTEEAPKEDANTTEK